MSSLRGRSAGLGAVALAAAALGACAHYEPQPVDVARFPAEVAARRLPAQPEGQSWSVPDLLPIALASNPTMTQAAAKLRTARAAAVAARVRPAIGLTLTAEYADERPRWLYGAAADIPLDVGGRRATRLNAADLQALQALYDYGEAAWAVRTALAKASAELSSSAEEIALATRARDLRRARFDQFQRRVAAGEDARPASLLAQADLAAAERRVADALARREAAVAQLARALAVDPTEARKLGVAAPSPAPAEAPPPGWREEAATARRDVLRVVADYDLAENALRLEIAKQYPDVRLGPGYSWDHGVAKLPFNLSLTLPPADLNRAAIAQAEAHRAETARALETAQASALAAVDQASTALAAARARAAGVADRDVPIAQRTASATERATSAGELDRTDQLGAEAALADAELALLDARNATRTASVDLEDSLRRTFDPREMTVLEDAVKAAGGVQ